VKDIDHYKDASVPGIPVSQASDNTVEAGDERGNSQAQHAGQACQGLVIPVLVLVGLFNYLDRALPAVLAEPIKRDLALSDTALGLINGFGFLVVYALAGIPIARLADRGSYAGVISASLGLWSFMTLLGGLVVSGWQLAVTRMGVALGEAGSLPASHAYVTRNFPPHQCALALSMLSLAVPLGNSIGLLAGGTLGEMIGWRGTLILMGGLGLALAPFVLFVLRRASRGLESAVPVTSPARKGLAILDSARQPGVAWILIASSFVAVGGYAAIAFAPAFLMRVHGLDLETVGIRFGLGAGMAGIIALLVTGWWSDRLVSRQSNKPLIVVVVMILIVLPFSIGAFIVVDPGTALVLAAISSVVPVAYLAPVVAALHSLVPSAVRAQVSALLLLCTAIMGGLGPLAVGLISDALQPSHGSRSLALAMLVVPAAFAVAACLFSFAARACKAEISSRVQTAPSDAS